MFFAILYILTIIRSSVTGNGQAATRLANGAINWKGDEFSQVYGNNWIQLFGFVYSYKFLNSYRDKAFCSFSCRKAVAAGAF